MSIVTTHRHEAHVGPTIHHAAPPRPLHAKRIHTHRVYEIKRPRARTHGTYLPWGRAALTLLSARLQEKEERARAKDIPL